MKRGFQKSFPRVRTRILGLSLLSIFFFAASSAFSRDENVKDERIPQRFVQQEVFSRISGFRGGGGIRGGGSSSGGRGSRGNGKGSGSSGSGAARAAGAANIPHHKSLCCRNSNRTAAKVALTLYACQVLASLLVIANN